MKEIISERRLDELAEELADHWATLQWSQTDWTRKMDILGALIRVNNDIRWISKQLNVH